MEDNEFYQKLGTYDSKGNMVRRMVTEVVRYLETSLVSHGADSFAQKIGDDGKIINPTFAQRSWASYEEYRDDKSKNFYFSDFKDLNNTQESFIDNPEIDNQENKQSMNEFELFIQSLVEANIIAFGEGQEANQENALALLKDLVSSRNNLQTQVTNLTTEKNSLTEQITNKEAEIANLKEMATVGKNHIASLRENAVATYKKLMGDQADETIVTMLNAETTGLATLISLTKDYQARLEEKFPLTCSKCGSHDVSRASSLEDPTIEEKKEETTQNQEKSTAEVMESLYRQKIK